MADLPLRDYQRAALDASHEARARGVLRQAVSMPTGSGKTVTAVHLHREYNPGSTVFLVHRDELARQAVDTFHNVAPGVGVGVVKAEQDEIGYSVTVASVPTVVNERRINRLLDALPRPRLVIADESHHAVANSWSKVIHMLDADLLFGMTATAFRADKIALGKHFDEIVYELPMLPLILSHQLAMPVGVVVRTDVDLTGVHTVAGDFNHAELSAAIDTPQRNRLVVDAWREHCWDKGCKRSVVFARDQAHCAHLREMFRDDGVACEMVIDSTPTAERQMLYRVFHEGKLPVIVNVSVLTEGWDEPLADAIVMARPTQSAGLFTQMVGRGLRAHPEKESTVILDIVDVTSKHNLITLATLAGREAAVRAGGSLDDEDAEIVIQPGEQTSFIGMVEQTARLRHKSFTVNLFASGAHRWYPASNGRWMAPAGIGTYLALWPQEDGYVPVKITKPSRYEPAVGERLFDRALDVQTARSLADALVPDGQLTSRSAAWLQAPATDKQRSYARSQGVQVPIDWTRGEADEILSRLEFERAILELREAVRRRGTGSGTSDRNEGRMNDD